MCNNLLEAREHLRVPQSCLCSAALQIGNMVSGLQVVHSASSAGMSTDHVQRILAVKSQAAVRLLLEEYPDIAKLEPATLFSRLLRLKVTAFLLAMSYIQCHPNSFLRQAVPM